jgi:predicted  nucleic acid-binding Zn-ribbon protein
LDATRAKEKRQLEKEIRECRAEAEKLRRKLNGTKTEDERRDMLWEVRYCEMNRLVH